MNKESFSNILVQRLAKARRVAVLTGAGVSAESGIATFRDAGGIWSKFRPEELANVHAFLQNPDLVQRWYRDRQYAANEAEPNAGHMALVELEELVDDFTLITQNVDNLHNRAGSRNVVELHGNITRNYCIECRLDIEPEDDSQPTEGQPARCLSCNGLVRPDVVWFGEMLPENALQEAFRTARASDVFLSIGTSAVVHPAADVPLAAGQYGAYVAEINIEASAIASMIDETVLGSSGTVLPKLVNAVRARKQSIESSL